MSTRGAYRIVAVATDLSIVALLYDIPKYRPSVSRSMDGDSRQHADECWCRCVILSRRALDGDSALLSQI